VLLPNQRKLLEVALLEMVAGWRDELDCAQPWFPEESDRVENIEPVHAESKLI
jgi:hypothetical protein